MLLRELLSLIEGARRSHQQSKERHTMTTKIEWATETWNPVTGCSNISEGCKNCYAIPQSERNSRMGGKVGHKYRNLFKVTMHPEELNRRFPGDTTDKGNRVPVERRYYFVCSMSDFFHDEISDDFILALVRKMANTPQHTFLLLTKRPARAVELSVAMELWNIPNIWLGVTAENNQRLNERTPMLHATGARVKFLSCEPLLGPLPDIVRYIEPAQPALSTG